MNRPLRLPNFPSGTTRSPKQAGSNQNRVDWLQRLKVTHLPNKVNPSIGRSNGSHKNGQPLPISRIILR